MLSEKCSMDKYKMEIEDWQEKYWEELSSVYYDSIEKWVNRLTEKEYERELWKHWKDIKRTIETKRTKKNWWWYWDRPALKREIRVDKHKWCREEFIEDYYTTQIECLQWEYTDFIVDIYMWD